MIGLGCLTDQGGAGQGVLLRRRLRTDPAPKSTAKLPPNRFCRQPAHRRSRHRWDRSRLGRGQVTSRYGLGHFSVGARSRLGIGQVTAR
eukprot:711999-Rhodomonas_salina.1